MDCKNQSVSSALGYITHCALFISGPDEFIHFEPKNQISRCHEFVCLSRISHLNPTPPCFICAERELNSGSGLGVRSAEADTEEGGGD